MTHHGAAPLPANWVEKLLPRVDFRERHSIDITASAGSILDRTADYRLKNDPLVRCAIALRELPLRVLGRTVRPRSIGTILLSWGVMGRMPLLSA